MAHLPLVHLALQEDFFDKNGNFLPKKLAAHCEEKHSGRLVLGFQLGHPSWFVVVFPAGQAASTHAHPGRQHGTEFFRTVLGSLMTRVSTRHQPPGTVGDGFELDSEFEMVEGGEWVFSEGETAHCYRNDGKCTAVMEVYAPLMHGKDGYRQ